MLDLSLLEMVSILTAFQLLMLGVVLLSKENIKRQSNRILSMYMFSNALLLIYFLFSLKEKYDFLAVSIFYYLLGPLIYLYVCSMCIKKFSLKPKHWRHGIIFAVMLLYVVGKIFLLNYGIIGTGSQMEYLIPQIILHLQIIFYIMLSLYTIYRYRKEIKNLYSSIEQINLSWLLFIIGAFTIMWLSDFTAFILGVFFNESGRIIHDLLVCSIVINLIFTIYLVYKGLHQPDAFRGIKSQKKYSGSKITKEATNKMAENLTAFMENEKPYLNPNLTIKDLSEQLIIHPKYLSQIINSKFSQNFYDFINQYRIQEAKDIMYKNRDEKMTILEILYEVGFNSKSAFNNAFKKNTGITPSEFKKVAVK